MAEPTQSYCLVSPVFQHGVKQLVPFDGSRMQVEMRDGTKILASRTRSKELRQLAI